MKVSEKQQINEMYIFKDSKVFRRAWQRPHSRYKQIYYAEREIKPGRKNDLAGFILNEKFYSLNQINKICLK